MGKKSVFFVVWVISLLFISLFASTALADDSIELTISGDGVTNTVTYTLKDLKGMSNGIFTGTYTMRTLVEGHNGKYTGVKVMHLLDKAGLKSTAKSVKFTAADGVSVSMNLADVKKGSYINEVDASKLPVIIGFSKDGYGLVNSATSNGYKESVENDGGPMRLVIGQNSEGERNSPQWLQNVIKIQVSTKSVGSYYNDIGKFYSWAEDSIIALTDRGVVSGVSKGKFGPEQNVTRAEFAKMIVLAKGITPVSKPKGLFNDVKTNSWYAPYVEAAANKGIIQGVGNKLFNPTGKITRNEIAVMIVRAIGLTDTAKKKDANDLAYKDKAKVPAWSAGYVAVATNKGFFDNIAVLYFNGDTALNRAETAVVIYRSLE